MASIQVGKRIKSWANRETGFSRYLYFGLGPNMDSEQQQRTFAVFTRFFSSSLSLNNNNYLTRLSLKWNRRARRGLWVSRRMIKTRRRREKIYKFYFFPGQRRRWSSAFAICLAYNNGSLFRSFSLSISCLFYWIFLSGPPLVDDDAMDSRDM